MFQLGCLSYAKDQKLKANHNVLHLQSFQSPVFKLCQRSEIESKSQQNQVNFLNY